MIFCIDDDVATLECLRSIYDAVSLQAQEFRSGEQFLENYRSDEPGCIIFDVSTTTHSGELLQSTLESMKITDPYLVLSRFSDFESAADIMRHGAFDCIEKPIRKLPLIRSINSALRESRARHSVDKRRKRLEREIAGLHNKDKMILQLLLRRKSTKEIALEMNMACATVDNYRSRLIGKVGLSSYLEFADAYCIMGLCTSQDECPTSYFDESKDSIDRNRA